MKDKKLVPAKKSKQQFKKMMKQKFKTKFATTPNPYLYGAGNMAAKIINQRCGGVEYTIDPNVDTDKPFILLCNHLSNRDFMIAVGGVYPKRLNFVVTTFYFKKLFQGAALRLMCAIPKMQFQSDPSTIRRMMTVLRSGGAVALYPEGQVSIDGTPCYMIPTIGKLVKAMKVDVVTGVAKGCYMTKPKWSKYSRTGKLAYEVTRLISAEELSSLSDEEVFNRIQSKLSHDDPQWAIDNGHAYKGKNLAEGLEGVLCYCPKCQSYYTLATKGDRLFCNHCGNTAILDEYGKLSPATEEDVVYSTVHQWREAQKALLATQIFEEGKMLSHTVHLRLCKDNGKIYEDMGSGTLHCDYSQIYFTGENFSYTFKWKNLYNFSNTPLIEFEIPSNQSMFSFTTPECPVASEHWIELAEIFLEQPERRKALAGEE